MPINWVGVNPSDWMAQIPNMTLISRITLPGAHDCTTQVVAAESPNLMAALGWVGFQNNVVCQSTDITGLLNMGVRYLDLRLYAQPVAGAAPNLVCVHGGGMLRHYCIDAVGVNLTFAAVQADCQAFLALHPTETIVVCIKDEEPNGQPFDATLFAQITAATTAAAAAGMPPPWYLLPATPTIGAVRGKMVLLRRFASAVVPSGLNLSTWEADRGSHNTIGGFSIPAVGTTRAWVQDEYNYALYPGTYAGNSKWNNFVLPSIGDFATRFLTSPTIPHINLTSCSNLGSIQTIAAALNPNLVATCAARKNTYACGWIVGDFFTPPICQHIYETNN